MKRRGLGMLCGALLCVLAGCGPGVGSELTPSSDGGTDSVTGRLPVLNEATVEIADVEGTSLRLRVRGSDFSSTSTVYWKLQRLATTFVSETELVAVLPWSSDVSWYFKDISVRTPTASKMLVSGKRALDYPLPVLLAATPEWIQSEPGAPVRVRVTGRNFLAGGKLVFRSVPYPTSVLSPELAEVELPASVLNVLPPEFRELSPDHLQLWVPVRYSEATAWSMPLLLEVRHPAPALEAVQPATLSATAGKDLPSGTLPGTVRLSLRGRGLRADTVVTWNGQALTTQVYGSVDDRDIIADLPRSMLTEAGLAEVRLKTSGPGGGVSSAVSIPVMAGPVLYHLSPRRVQAGSAGFTLVVDGEGFGQGATISWNGRTLVTDSSSGLASGGVRLTAQVPASEVTQPGTYAVKVRRGSDALVSGTLLVEVVDALPAPIAQGLSPAVVSAGDAPVRLRVRGTNFTRDSIILVGGRARPTTFDADYWNETWISTALQAEDVAEARVHEVTVETPGPGGGTSLPLLFRVDARRPVPVLTTVEPGTAAAGTPGLTLTLTGQGLGGASVVRWNGDALTTSLKEEPGQLSAYVDAARLAKPGVARLTVFNPAPGGGTSAAFQFVIQEAGAPLFALTPAFLEAGATRFFPLKLRSLAAAPSEDSPVITVDGTARSWTGAWPGWDLLLPPEDRATVRDVEVRLVHGEAPAGRRFLQVTGPRPPRIQSLVPGVVSVGEWPVDEERPLFLDGWGIAWRDQYDTAEPVPDPLPATLEWGGGSHPVRLYNARGGEEFIGRMMGADVVMPVPLGVSVSRAAEGGVSSLPVFLNVVEERPVPDLVDVVPSAVQTGVSVLLRLTVHGLHAASEVRWNGQPLPGRRWKSLGQVQGLEVTVPASLLSAPGVARLTVVTPAPGGGESLPLAVQVE